MVRKRSRNTRKRSRRKVTRKMRGGGKRLLLIIRGEVFRLGGKFSRRTGAEESYKDQEDACRSHMDLVRKMESNGYTVDILLNTYSTKYDEDIKRFYGESLKYPHFHTTKFKDQYYMMKNCIEAYQKIQTHYDAICIIRTDMFLKQKFVDEYNPSTDTVQFLCVLYSKHQRSPSGHFMVNDTYLHFPHRSFDKLNAILQVPNSESVFMHHFHQYLEFIPLKYGREYSLLTKHFYDANTEGDLNPYYRLIGRPESKVWHDEGRDLSELPEFKGLV